MREASRTSRIVQVTLWALCLNVLLTGLKLAVGIVVGSSALVADAIHSMSDMSTDVIVLIGVRISSRPADESHAYGHGRFETMAASLVGVVLIGAAVFVVWEGGLSLYHHKHSFPGVAVLVVASVSILSKESIYHVTRRVARRTGSAALYVNAWHQRSDALSSVAVLVGAIAGLLGWGHADQLAAVAVGVMIGMIGLGALWRLFLELTEGSISSEERESISRAIQGVGGVMDWHRLRTRLVGRQVFMDVHVLVDERLSVAEGHAIASAVEGAIARSMERPIDIVVHFEPAPDADVPGGPRRGRE